MSVVRREKELRIASASGALAGGKYRVFASLGQGGMADVDLGAIAGPEGFNKLVVLKRLRARLSFDPAVIGMFLDEARLAARLNHPNLVHTYEFGEENGAYFIAMEYIDGKSLASLLDAARSANTVVSPDVWAKVVADALAGLHCAHELRDYDGAALGVVHRDVSPQNIVVSYDGDVKVVDFGIAKTRLNRTETESQVIKGKVAYMAPEQADPRSEEPLDRRADLFAMGIVLWECLAETRLVTGDARSAIAQILGMEFPPPSSKNARVPPALDAIVLRALEREPTKRFQTAQEMRAALEHYLRRRDTSIGEAEIGSLVSNLFVDEREEVRREIFAHMRAIAPDGAIDAIPISRAKVRVDGGDASGDVLRGAPLSASRGGAFDSSLSLQAVRTSTAASPRDARARKGIRLAFIASLILLVGSGLLVLRSRPDVATSSASVAASAPPNTEARQAYELAVGALRAGDIAGAKAGFERAASLDPVDAAAQLRAAWWTSASRPIQSRARFERAMQLRASLSARDDALLQAFEPELYRSPADLEESERRLTHALEQFPRDAEMLFYAGRTRQHLGRTGDAIAAFDAALQIDGGFAMAWWGRGSAQQDAADVEGARSSYDHCLAASPAAASCLIDRAWLDAVSGRCALLEADARRLTVIDPNGTHGYAMLARALAARESPATEEALTHAWAALPEAGRARAELYDRGQLAALRGDFDEAIRLATELSGLVRGSTSELDQSEPALQLLDAYEEIGDAVNAAKTAEGFLAHRDAWAAAPAIGDSASQGATPVMLAALRRSGAITREAFQARRDAWAHDAFAALAPDARGELWYVAYAAPVDSRADADRALHALEEYPIGKYARHVPAADALMGLVLARADQPVSAAPRLEAATSACTALDIPYLHVRSVLELGAVKEALGDMEGACASYAQVVARWGAATPSSRTAATASERTKALRCAALYGASRDD